MICRRLFSAGWCWQTLQSAVRAGLLAGLVLIGAASTTHAQTYFSENFDGLSLNPPVDETIPADNPVENVWSPDGPAGWSVDRSGVPAGGVTEWRGWNFVDPIWWNNVAGQERANFATEQQGFVIAVADGDEWDDLPHDPGMQTSIMSTPAISLAGIASGTSLNFDSSWRAEVPQIGTLSASFDGGAPVEILRYESDENSDFYQPDANPDAVSVPVTIPNGAQNVQFSWGYTGGNNWWWAVDNIEFGSYFEDFEGVDLQTNVSEGRAIGLPFNPDETWTNEPPAGWNINSEDTIGIDEEGIGVTEWKGWSFADKNFWNLVAGDQNRSFFSKGENVVAIADPDEWDDLGAPGSIGSFFSDMDTPAFNIAGAPANTLELNFDSSWRPECCDDGDLSNDQTAIISVSYDGGQTYNEVMYWDSSEGEFFHPDSENENVTLALNNPAGATTAKLRFSLVNAKNDWWWAIDNILVSGQNAGVTGDFDGNGTLDAADIDALSAAVLGGGGAQYDLNNDGSVTNADREMWVNDLKNTYFGDSNLDGEFSSGDLVFVFTAGEYEDGVATNSGWAEGDWNGDKEFDSSDFVTAFAAGGYEVGPRAAVSAVPEPSSLVLFALGMLSCLRRRK